MKRSIILTICAALILAVNIYSQNQNELAGTWQGKLPCADCEYINYKLILLSDNSYKDEMDYYNKDVKPFQTAGKWSFSDNILTLDESTGMKQKFRLSGNTLNLLDASGNSVPQGQITRMTKEQPVETDRWAAKRSKGIDFTGMGNEPFWNIDLNLDDKTLTYSKLGEGSITFTDIKEAPVMDAPVITYHGNTAKHEITVDIIKQECTDNMAGDVFPYKVTVKLRTGKSLKVDTLNGCGTYLADLRLGGNWLISKVNGKDISEYKIMKEKSPQMVLSLSLERFSGNAGCNSFFGSFESKGNKLRFGKTASTMMMCPDMKLENDVFSIINEGYYSFIIENNILTLIDMKGNVVIDFIKAD